MFMRVGFEIELESTASVPMLLALSTFSQGLGRMIGDDSVKFEPNTPSHRYLDRFGNWITRVVAPAGHAKLWSDCFIEVDGQADRQHPDAAQHSIPDLPDSVLQYLIPSRYCDSDNLTNDAWCLFSNTPYGWERVKAVTAFVHAHVTFGYQFGRATKTASDVFKEKTGVCRDFSHLAISLCRALNIPARYASGYLGDVGVPYSGPGDFCAWFEVFLGGKWHTFDARYNVPRIGRVLMVHGADASDVAMITSFGNYQLKHFKVWANEVTEACTDGDLLEQLAVRPQTEALVFASSARAA